MIIPIANNYRSFDIQALKQMTMSISGRDISGNNEPIAILSRSFDADALHTYKHLSFTFIIVTVPEATQEFINLAGVFNHTWIESSHKMDLHLLTGTLDQWIELITKNSHDILERTNLQILNKLHNWFEGFGLSSVFKGYSKQPIRDGYLLEKR